MTDLLDRRTTAARPDLAADSLRGRVDAARFVQAVPRMITSPLAQLRRRPEPDAPLDTEALRGEAVSVFEENEGWAWAQLAGDGYVGYLPSAALGSPEPSTHKVSALRTFIYPGPDLKLPVSGALTLGARCRVDRVADGYAAILEGFVWAGHLAELREFEEDFVAVAERFVGVPYLWGGKSSLGLDCSALVQVSLAAAGYEAPRDSDMQARDVGTPIARDSGLRRGDLVFWKGHVGVMRDSSEVLHANGNTMIVMSEPLATAEARIRETGGEIARITRLLSPARGA